ncbi:siderophore-interacting protein, partial [Cronobacter sakazakii]
MTASYRIFNVTLRRRISVTPSLLRCVFTGPDVAHMKHEAPDQRIKLMFARPDGNTARLPVSDSWYQDYLALPRERRPFMRTYTLRALRREACELDVEFVLHGDNGPASRWAMNARPGDTLQIVAPDRDFPGDSGGYEWSADEALRQALLVADETALPAALGILEQLARQPAPPRVQAFLEVPLAQDIQPLRYPFADIHWLARDENAAHGERLLEAVKDAATLPISEQVSAQMTEEDDDEET